MPTQSRFVPVGTQAPDFTLLAESGGQTSLSDYHGEKHAVFVFLRGFF